MSRYDVVTLRKMTEDTWVVSGGSCSLSPSHLQVLADPTWPIGSIYDVFVDDPGGLPVAGGSLLKLPAGSCPAMEETDPLDDLMKSAGVNHDPDLPPPERRSYIKRQIEFEEAQKQSRAKIAEAMASGEKMPESKLEWRGDPRGGRFVGGATVYAPWMNGPDPDPLPDPIVFPSMPSFNVSLPTTFDFGTVTQWFDEIDKFGKTDDLATDAASSLARKLERNRKKANDNNRKGWKH
jgi:hypothetical protein